MKPIDIEEIRRMVPVAGMLRAPDASPEKPSPVLDAAEVRAALLERIDGLPTGRVASRVSNFLVNWLDGAGLALNESMQVVALINMLRERGEEP